MKARELISRKYHQGWTDAEVMVLLLLADMHLGTLTEITDAAGMPTTTGWRAIDTLLTRQLLCLQLIDGTKYYCLTDQGRTALLLLLK
jgi:predicted transcriptional regulator